VKRRSLLLIFAVGCLFLAAYAALQVIAASMAASALVGVSTHTPALHHYGMLSWIWFAVALAALVAFVAAVIAVRRSGSRVPPSS
jgi:hypothetical protein